MVQHKRAIFTLTAFNLDVLLRELKCIVNGHNITIDFKNRTNGETVQVRQHNCHFFRGKNEFIDDFIGFMCDEEIEGGMLSEIFIGDTIEISGYDEIKVRSTSTDGSVTYHIKAEEKVA